MTPREREVMEVIRKNPSLSQQEIADILSIKRSSVAVHINNLSNQGYILGRGYILRNEPYIIAIGGANVDIIGYTFDDIMYQDSNPGHIMQNAGGVARNIAENISRLDFRTSIITVIGEDERGKYLLDDMVALGIDTENVILLPHERTSVYLAILNEKRDMELAISDMDIMEKLTPELLYKKKKIIENASLAVVDTNLTKESLEYLFKNIRQKYFVEAVSAKKAEKLKEFIDKIYFIKANQHEAEVLADEKIITIEDAVEAGKKLIRKGLGSMVITMGEKGLVYIDNRNIEIVESEPLEVVNASGAGDAFMSAYVYASAKRTRLREKLRFATAASRIALMSKKTNSEKLLVDNIKEEMKNVK